MLINYRFKRSFIDSKNGAIRLYYIDSVGNSLVLNTNRSCESHIWANVPAELQNDAENRVKELIKD